MTSNILQQLKIHYSNQPISVHIKELKGLSLININPIVVLAGSKVMSVV